MVLLFTCTSGCSLVKDSPLLQDDPFKILYSASGDIAPPEKVGSSVGTESITLSAYMMPLSLFTRILSDRFGVGMVYSESLADKKISGEFKDSDLQSLLNVIARQIQVDIIRVGNTFFIGLLRPEDRGIFVRRVVGYSSSELTGIVQAMLSSQGKCNVTSDSVIVVADHESVLRRVAEMVDYLESVETGSWIVQLYFVSLRKDAMVEAGLNTTSSGRISYNLSNSTINLDDFKLDGLFSFSMGSSYADVFASPMLLVLDGTSAKWQDGQRIPIPRKTVSDYGTVTVVGYDYVDTGFIVDLTVKQGRHGAANVNITISLSDVKGYIEEAPITATSEYKFNAELIPLKMYLVGELSNFKALDTQKEILMLGRDQGKTAVQLWAKVYRIGSPLPGKYPVYNPLGTAPADDAGAPPRGAAPPEETESVPKD